MLLASGIKWKHLLILFLLGLIIFSASWFLFLKDYQKDRVITFLNPQKDIEKSGYNIRQSLIAIGHGGLWGRGLGNGSQAQFGFLPEATNDFIFASFIEERGLVGAFLLFSLFAIVFWRIIKIAKNASNNFARLFCLGFSVFLLSQLVINIGMNLGLLPVVGISLPLFSFGGSNLIASFIGLGIIESIKVNS